MFDWSALPEDAIRKMQEYAESNPNWFRDTYLQNFMPEADFMRCESSEPVSFTLTETEKEDRE